MAVVQGQIETLKKIKETLNQNGITRFSSINEIKSFTKNYVAEKNEIPKLVESELDNEIDQLRRELSKCRQYYDILKIDITDEIKSEIKKLEDARKYTSKKSRKNLFYKIFFYPKIRIIDVRKKQLQKSVKRIVHQNTYFAKHEASRIKNKLDSYLDNREKLISERCLKLFKKLEHAKNIIDDLNTLIAGAVGENLVVKEIQKLPDNFHLYNDFSVKFMPPIYNRKDKDRIFSIQIDHLLVCEAGVFILETKNWSQKSIKNIDLRSPVEQILRSSYALFVLLNNQSKHGRIKLDHHHWGSKEIPVRNIIVMINKKPKEEFKHVKVLSLKELNGYLTYFDPVLSKTEVENICSFLTNKFY